MHPLIAEHVSLRNLENPVLFDLKKGELYNLDDEAYEAARFFTGHWELSEISKKLKLNLDELEIFVKDLIDNGLLIDKKMPTGLINLIIETQKPPIPTLRNILVHITSRCNLKCVHCYVGEKKNEDLPPNLIKQFVPEFYWNQGLRVLISGGEPLLHPQFTEILKFLKLFRLRVLLLTNGTLITPEKAGIIKKYVHEVQISIDGIKSHDEFRKDITSFSKAINAIKVLKDEEIPIEVATMIHKKNLDELPELSAILEDLKVENWTLDIPVLAGDLEKNKDYLPELEKAVNALKIYGWGGFPEEEKTEFACGSHVCAIMPNGDVAKCQFYGHQPVGNLNEASLIDCWKKIQQKFILKKENLQCAKLNCPYIDECKGGCRYRAYKLTNNAFGADKVKCLLFDFNPNNNKGGP